MDNGYSYWINLLLATDQLFNAVFKGACDETFSSRTYRMSQIKHGYWSVLEKVIDTLFYKDVDSAGRKHCELSYLVEMNRGHMPKAMLK